MRKFALVILTLIFTFGLTQFSLAQGYGLKSVAEKADYDVTGKTNIFTMVATVIQAVLAVLSILFFIYLTYAGILWMKARGNETLITEAKDMIYNAVIGLVVVMSAYGLTTFVMGRLNL